MNFFLLILQQLPLIRSPIISSHHFFLRWLPQCPTHPATSQLSKMSTLFIAQTIALCLCLGDFSTSYMLQKSPHFKFQRTPRSSMNLPFSLSNSPHTYIFCPQHSLKVHLIIVDKALSLISGLFPNFCDWEFPFLLAALLCLSCDSRNPIPATQSSRVT